MRLGLDANNIDKKEFKMLMNEKPANLFKEARNLAAPLPLSYCSTIVINGNCKINPPCRHCRWRSASALDPSFHKINSLEDILAKAKMIEKTGISRVLLLSGWMGPDLPEHFYEIVRAIKKATRLEICGGFGYLSKESLSALKSAGLDGYFCGLEVPDKILFKKIRPGDDFNARIDTIKDTKECGLKAWSGFIFGAGETSNNILFGLGLLRKFKVDVIYINPLVPSPYTEMENVNPPNLMRWSKVIAITRWLFPNSDIVTKPEYAEWAFRAGASACVHVSPQKSEVATLEHVALKSKEITLN